MKKKIESTIEIHFNPAIGKVVKLTAFLDFDLDKKKVDSVEYKVFLDQKKVAEDANTIAEAYEIFDMYCKAENI